MKFSEMLCRTTVKKRIWYWPCFYVCKGLVKLGADDDRLARWLVDHALKVEKRAGPL